jgi:hypothetical protein
MPVRANVGLNRWLAKDREEAYSAWLAWLLGELKSVEDVLKLLGVREPEVCRLCRGVSYDIIPEHRIPPYGRLDILITCGQQAAIVVELKKTTADVAETEKQARYCEWLKKQRRFRFKYRVLLAVGETSEDNCWGFMPRGWEDVCIELRRMLPRVRARLDPVTAAMFVAFVSAVETNLLGLRAPKVKQDRSLLYARTADHLEQSLGSRK